MHNYMHREAATNLYNYLRIKDIDLSPWPEHSGIKLLNLYIY
jgi:hypothetical protein